MHNIDNIMDSIQSQLLKIVNASDNTNKKYLALNAVLDFCKREKELYIMLDNYGNINSSLHLVHANCNVYTFKTCDMITFNNITNGTNLFVEFLIRLNVVILITFSSYYKSFDSYMRHQNCYMIYDGTNYTYMYNNIKKRNANIHEELISVVLHPDKIEKLLKLGISFDNF